jgi:hypothetical protein
MAWPRDINLPPVTILHACNCASPDHTDPITANALIDLDRRLAASYASGYASLIQMVCQLDLHYWEGAIVSGKAAVQHMEQTIETGRQKLSVEQESGEISAAYESATEEGIQRIQDILSGISELLTKAEHREVPRAEDVYSLLDRAHRLVVDPPRPETYVR